MQILFLCNKPPYPTVDGGTIASWGIISAMAEAGNHVSVLAMNTRKHHVSPFDLPESVTSKVTYYLAEIPAKINPFAAARNLLFSKLPYNAERFIDNQFEKKIHDLLLRQKFDIVQLEGLYLCPYIKTIRENSQATIVYRSHNIEHEIWERSLKQARIPKKLYLNILQKRLKKFEIEALNTYDLLVPITQRDEKILNQLGNTKPSLPLPAGIDIGQLEHAAGKNKTKARDLFFIGALDWAPNQEGLLWFLNHCWGHLRKHNPKISLTIAGRNAPEWFVQKLKQPGIVYEGEVACAQTFMKQHGVMIAPLLSGSGMRVKIIEAMALKKPVVTTNIGVEGIDAVNGHHLMIADKPMEFVKQIETLIAQPQLVSAISDNCYTFVQLNYSNKELAARLSAFYVKNIV